MLLLFLKRGSSQKLAFLVTTMVDPISASSPPTLLENVTLPCKVMMLDVTVSAVETLYENVLLMIVKSTLNYCY